MLITMYNSGDLIGRCTPLIDRLLLHSRTWLAIWSWARLAFIPCFYFAAKYADQGWMIFLCIMLGWTNGHLSTNIFMVAPNGYTVSTSNSLQALISINLFHGVGGFFLHQLQKFREKTVVNSVNFQKSGIQFLHDVGGSEQNICVLFCLQGPEQNAVGNILVLFLILGLSIGVTADWLWLIGKGW